LLSCYIYGGELDMKVRITNKVTSFGMKDATGHKTYGPGDIVDIPENKFCPDFMQKVTELPSGEVKVEETKPAETMVRRQVGKLPKES